MRYSTTEPHSRIRRGLRFAAAHGLITHGSESHTLELTTVALEFAGLQHIEPIKRARPEVRLFSSAIARDPASPCSIRLGGALD